MVIEVNLEVNFLMGKNTENGMQPQHRKHRLPKAVPPPWKWAFASMTYTVCRTSCDPHFAEAVKLFPETSTDLVGFLHHCVQDLCIIYKFEILRVSVINRGLNLLIFLSDDIKVSVNDFIIRAAAVTLKVSGQSKITVASKWLLA